MSKSYLYQKIAILAILLFCFIITLKSNHEMSKTVKQILRKECIDLGTRGIYHDYYFISEFNYHTKVSTESFVVYQVGDFYNGNWKK